MLKPLPILLLGHPSLRAEAVDIKGSVLKTQAFAKRLFATCKANGGMGLAATQVGSTLPVFVMMSRPNKRYPKAPRMKPTAIITPVIHEMSEIEESSYEGCLSIPGIRAMVPRPTWIKVSYVTDEGKAVIRKRFSGMLARIFLHEFDHLQGVVFLDRVTDKDSYITEAEYQKMMKKKAKKKAKAAKR